MAGLRLVSFANFRPPRLARKQEMAEDLDGDVVVGVPDFNMLRSVYNTTSPDATQTQ